MEKERGEKSVMVDLETHHKLKIMAAIRQLSIKQVLKELVEKAKTKGGDEN